ncbi:MAG: hypothetical protein ABEJ42_03975 [Halobacteriaceae archaeon]
MATYYDLVLGLIPLTLVGVSGGLRVGGLTTTAAVTVGCLLAITLVAHALFVRSPVHGASGGGTTMDAGTVGGGGVGGTNAGGQ